MTENSELFQYNREQANKIKTMFTPHFNLYQVLARKFKNSIPA